MSQRTRVPEQEALAIRYPGYVQSAEAALDTMGGLNAIERAHFDGGANYVQVNCRPGDHLAHPLYGEQKRSNGLLLRLTQPRASTDGSAGPEQPTVRAEVLARVTSSYRFMSMADFQYADVASKDIGNLPEVDGPYGLERSPMNLLPPLFSKQDEPQDYSFRQPASTSAQQQRASQSAAKSTSKVPASQQVDQSDRKEEQQPQPQQPAQQQPDESPALQ